MKRKASHDGQRSSKKARTQSYGSGFAASDRSVRPVGSPLTRPEVKYLGGTLSVSATNTGTLGAFNVPALGTGPTERTGEEFKLVYFEGTWEAIAGDNTNAVRLMLFQWFPDTNLDSPSVAKLLEHTALPAISCYVADKRARKKFRVLYDRTVALSANGPAGLISSIALDRKYFRPTIIETGFTTGTGKLFYLVISDSGAAAHPAVNLSAMTYFEDS